MVFLRLCGVLSVGAVPGKKMTFLIIRQIRLMPCCTRDDSSCLVYSSRLQCTDASGYILLGFFVKCGSYSYTMPDHLIFCLAGHSKM